MIMKLHHLLVLVPLVGTLAACSSDSNYDFAASDAARAAQVAADSPPQALFSPDPSAPVLPFPNSLFFTGTLDGTLNIPVAATADQSLSNPSIALNQSDGFSTTSPLVTAVSESLDPASLLIGDTIRIFEVNTAQGIAVTGINGELSNPLLMAAVENNGQLALIPTVPLKPKTDYMVVLTSRITDVDGMPLQPSLIYGLLKGSVVLSNPSLEALRGATGSQLAAAQTVGIDPATVALTWVFKTQSIREVLQAVKDQSAPSALVLGNSGANTGTPGIGGQGKADIYVGALAVPYYQTAVGEDLNPLPAVNGFWKNASNAVVGAIGGSGAPEYAPVATTTESIPVLMSVPNATSASGGNVPANGWPVTIFQHGITRNRTDMLALADAMADAGRVVIAIDIPMHGLTDAANPFHAANTPFSERERTFNIDVQVNALAEGETAVEGAAASGPDGKIDDSGANFINLTNLANSRDNFRQGVADLFVLSASVGSAQVEGVQLDASNLTFVGHSLGGIIGTTMLSYDASFQAATLAMPGGGIAQLLANSPSFGPRINGGLAAVGIATGSADYNSFLIATQTLVDSGDPINHASILGASGNTRIHMIEVIGDQVVPNFVATAPLSGTDPLARMMGLTQVDASATGSALVKFSAGDHGSILSPATNLEAFTEMQIQTATFAATSGTVLPITDTTVIQAVE
ncbi:MAG: pimeloyl-ACP methyl ester carboxylesterase [Gammaproteobacteria bacterium]|jgi:pimeloyl-ACP methyl ester carboxylesterase